MSPFSRSNKGYRYLLTVIDVFSKYGWIVPLKTKTGKEVTQAFRKLFLDGYPSRLWTDKARTSKIHGRSISFNGEISVGWLYFLL